VGITPQQFEKMKVRLSGTRRSAPASVTMGSDHSPPFKHSLILGIDPSLRGTGFGVIRLEKPHPVALAHGTITCPPSWLLSRCLLKIATELRAVILQYQPTACAVEGLFFAQNLQTALIMGEARGASLVAAAEGGLEIFEISPRKMKLAIVGYGGAQKSAVGQMVKRMLQLVDLPEPDAADALGLALTLAQETGRHSLAAPKQL
jgi:crossover junction endodeoxyribonuclease RuvC